jgi:hypothetical protein
MRSWRALLALCGAYLLVCGGVRLGVATFSAAEVPAVLVFMGNFWLDYVVWALPVPIVARAAVLLAKSLGLGGNRVMTLNVIGILALPRAWQGLAAYEHWERRPAPAEYTQADLAYSGGLGRSGSLEQCGPALSWPRHPCRWSLPVLACPPPQHLPGHV